MVLVGGLGACEHGQIIGPPEPNGPQPPTVTRAEDERLAELVRRCGTDKPPFARDVRCPQGLYAAKSP